MINNDIILYIFKFIEREKDIKNYISSFPNLKSKFLNYLSTIKDNPHIKFLIRYGLTDDRIRNIIKNYKFKVILIAEILSCKYYNLKFYQILIEMTGSQYLSEILFQVNGVLDYNVLKLVIDNYPNIREKINRLIPREIYAVASPEIVNLLIENGIDIHGYDEYPLRIAIYFNNIEAVKCLIESGADLEINKRENLIEATSKGYLDIVKIYLEIIEDINFDDGLLLSYSAISGNLKLVQYLVQRGANINIDNDRPLRWAVEYSKFKIVKYLVQSGANIDVYDGWCLRIAINSENIFMINLLLSLGIEVGEDFEEYIEKIIEDKQENNILVKELKIILENYGTIMV